MAAGRLRTEQWEVLMRRHAAAVLVAVAAATTAVGLAAQPAFAECMFVPPWPPITQAIPSARSVVIGDVVAGVDEARLGLGPDDGPRDYALRVTRVLRGDARPGELLDIQYLLP